jgi:hypothetical protein
VIKARIEAVRKEIERLQRDGLKIEELEKRKADLLTDLPKFQVRRCVQPGLFFAIPYVMGPDLFLNSSEWQLINFQGLVKQLREYQGQVAKKVEELQKEIQSREDERESCLKEKSAIQVREAQAQA